MNGRTVSDDRVRGCQQESPRRLFVLNRNDGVVELNCHGASLQPRTEHPFSAPARPVGSSRRLASRAFAVACTPASSRADAGLPRAPPGPADAALSRHSCLASSTQQMNSLRARGVMSFQASSAVGLAISATRKSPGSLCTTPPGTLRLPRGHGTGLSGPRSRSQLTWDRPSTHGDDGSPPFPGSRQRVQLGRDEERRVRRSQFAVVRGPVAGGSGGAVGGEVCPAGIPGFSVVVLAVFATALMPKSAVVEGADRSKPP